MLETPNSPLASAPVAPPIARDAVRLRNVSRTFPGGVQAVNNINLHIRPREFVALLGPSGCGKSTLLRIIAGLDQPDEGEVSVDSAQTQSSGTAIAYVFQDATLLPWRTVLNNVALPLELLGVGKLESQTRATAALANVGLSDALARYPAQLSGGMRMRASLARALVTDPALLL